MPTKLSQYCERVIEAAWLVAVIVVPVFFNVYSSRIFEPDKIALLRSLSLIILGAWFVKIFDEGRFRWEAFQPNRSQIHRLLKIPLVIPVLAIVIIYILATIFSVSPKVSILGSYQRLQGTYTTFSYIIIFAAMAVNLRRRAQVERLITIIIIASLPVSLYGILQRYKFDPIPWGGDTTVRIASSMGNSIFVAAYLIMVFPLTLGRIIDSFRAILTETSHIFSHMVRATIYIILAVVQILALYMSGSRGPMLGWLAGLFFIVLMLTVLWQKRWATIAIVVASVAMAAFLLVFNIEKGPLEKLRSSPAIGRFGLLLNAESNSALVRRYIWEGAVEMVLPHPPLEYPNGQKDIFNVIRPIVGYGPESMFVAYNRFYVPELGLVERRNATPDRSHNETWDTLVITGILGLAAYLTIFSAVFYYGLKWIGLIPSQQSKKIFWGFYIAGGLIGALVLSLWRGFAYVGVGLPFGIFIGLVMYIILAAITYSFEKPRTSDQLARLMILLVLMAAIISHFVEINFGIAIAVTRMYFWIYIALLLVVGFVMPQVGLYGQAIVLEVDTEAPRITSGRSGVLTDQPAISSQSRYSGSKKRRMEKTTSRRKVVIRKDRSRGWLSEAIVSGILIAVLMATIGFDLIAYNLSSNTAVSVINYSLTAIRNNEKPFGVLGLVLMSWIIGVILIASEVFLLQTRKGNDERYTPGHYIKIIGVIFGTSFLLSFLYWLLHSGSIASITRFSPQTIDELRLQVSRFAGLLTNYYIYIIILVFIAAWFLSSGQANNLAPLTIRGAIIGAFAIIVGIFLVAFSNLRVIQADVTFKLAEQFTRSDTWPVAVEIYKQANDLAPNEDYYYLFLGRAYFEQAKTISDPAQREGLFAKAEKDLITAQTINPLNTDHTANLARLYSLWAADTVDPVMRQERLQLSDEYFARAINLSPKNVRLYTEWAYLILGDMDDPERAFQILQTALDVDPSYGWTYGLLGDYYARTAASTENQQEKRALQEKAAEYYNSALSKPGDALVNFRIALSLGDLGVQNNLPHEAIKAYQQALTLMPNTSERWKIEEAIARLYYQVGDLENALLNAQSALSSAPNDQKGRLQSLVDQITIQTP